MSDSRILDKLDKLSDKTEESRSQLESVDKKLEIHVNNCTNEFHRSRDADKKFEDIFDKHVEEDKTTNSKYIELLEKLSDQILDSNNCINTLTTKMDLSIQKLQFEIKSINKLDEIQNQQLAEHIAGVNTLKELVMLQKQEMDFRMRSVENTNRTPNNWKIWLYTNKMILTTAIAVAAGGITLLKFWDELLKLLAGN